MCVDAVKHCWEVYCIHCSINSLIRILSQQNIQKVMIWEMDGTGIKTQYERSNVTEFSGSRKTIGALQSTMKSVPLTVGLSAESDTGISSTDGITKNKTPKIGRAHV